MILLEKLLPLNLQSILIGLMEAYEVLGLD